MTQRLDAALAARGLARSRTAAQQLIRTGAVSVDGTVIVKASHLVTDESALEVSTDDHYVSRAAHKLIGALNVFPIRVAGALALDAGASTGGFTQVLLEREARTVVALDVGHGQLAPAIRADPRVRVVEGENVRDLSPARWGELTHELTPPEVVVADLSFISLTQVLPALAATAALNAEFLLLIKPQFEVGRSGVREGIVRDAQARAEAVERVAWEAHDCGLRTAGLIASPLPGTHGNREVVAWFSRNNGSAPSEWSQQIREVTA